MRSGGSLPADSATEAVVGGGGACGFALGPRAYRLGCQGGRASLLVSSVAVTICVSSELSSVEFVGDGGGVWDLKITDPVRGCGAASLQGACPLTS